jgi:deoxyribonuclease V
MTGPSPARCAAVDVQYPAAGGARAAVVLADDPLFTAVVDERVCWLPNVAAYQPGRFFARELPALRAVLAGVAELALVFIDGYVDLDPQGRAGLGARLHAQIHVPVIGVAKTAFHTATHAIAVNRGTATRPLYVTSAGIPADQAAALVTRMAGPYRLPDALRRVDALARGNHLAPLPAGRWPRHRRPADMTQRGSETDNTR